MTQSRMNDALSSKVEAVRWCRLVGIHEYHAAHLIAHFKSIEDKPAEEILDWQASQAAEIDSLLSATEQAKVRNLLALGAWTPFGLALEASEARHAFHLWHTIAKG
jgi:hypothetical protein